MKKVLGALLCLVGLLLAAAGVVGVVMIGSDNVIAAPSTTVKPGEAKALVSTPGVLAFKNTTMRVSASSDQGKVFIGRGHPVDVTSYLNGAPVLDVTKVGPGGTTTKARAGKDNVTIPDPTVQKFWTQKVSGAGTQTLSLSLDGGPAQFVVMPLAGASAITFSCGVAIAHGFALSIAAVIVGLILIGLGVVLLRRPRRRSASPADAEQLPDGSSVATSDAASKTTSGPSPSGDDDSTEPRTGGRARMVSFVGASVLLPSVAGCGVIPQSTPAWSNSAVTRTAMTSAEATAALKDYDVRNNAVIQSTHKTFNISEWTKVDTGSVLAEDQYSTKHDEATGKGSASSFTHNVKEVYSPGFASYPMYALTTQTTSSAPSETNLVAMRRQSVTAPWMMMSQSSLDASLPKPAKDASLTAAQKQQVLKAATAVQEQVNTGKGDLALPEQVTKFLKQWRVQKDFLKSATVNATLFNVEATDQLGPDGSIQAARSVQGSVALVNFRIRADYVAKDNYLVNFPDEDFAKVIGQLGPREALRFRTSLTIAMTVDNKGKPTIVGSDMSYLL